MKKTTIICFLSFIFISLSSGEINRYNRKIEFGVEAEGGFSNNYIKATDILVKDLVIDIAKLADDLYGKDFVVDFNVGAKAWLALNFSEKFRLNFFWGVDASGYSSISQNIPDSVFWKTMYFFGALWRKYIILSNRQASWQMIELYS